MSNKTFFKRIALTVVTAMGFGLLAVAPSSAATIARTLSIGSATSTAVLGDTATTTLTQVLTGEATNSKPDVESATILYSCYSTGAGGSACPTVKFWKTRTQAQDTSTLMGWQSTGDASMGITAFERTSNVTDSLTVGATSGSSTWNIKTASVPNAGTFNYTFYTKKADNSGVQTSVTWTLTVSADNVTGSGLAAYYFTSDVYTTVSSAFRNAATVDSAVVVDQGSLASNTPVAYGLFAVKNSAGETKTVYGNLVNDSLTATITSGPGALSNSASTPSSGSSTVTLNVQNGILGAKNNTTTETLTVLSTGVAGTTTIRVTNLAGTTVATLTVIFTGGVSTIPQAWLSDTVVQSTQASPTVKGIAKDAAGNTLKSGYVYLYSSDTSVAGDVPTSFPNTKTTTHQCAIASTGLFSCSVTITDTGTVTLTVRDSYTVTASTAVSPSLTFTVSGVAIRTLTATFDKATYAPGERAVITLTALNSAGAAMAGGNLASAFSKVRSLGNFSTVTGGQSNGGTNAVAYDAAAFNGYYDTGVETRVVTMPSYEGTFNVTFTIGTWGDRNSATTDVVASAKVVDPTAAAQIAAIANAQAAADAATAAAKAAGDAAVAEAKRTADAAVAAAKAAGDAAVAEAKRTADAATAAAKAAQAAAVAQAAAAQASADAATDAALQAIDAANAATDAANLAAEAADAATVAAQESKDAADAATAAVESLATQVATLMAALQAQITSLANVVAKIAKKVKA